jgi:hypothetical protein
MIHVRRGDRDRDRDRDGGGGRDWDGTWFLGPAMSGCASVCNGTKD